MTDVESLVLAARDGDLAAYGRLVERTQSMVYTVCRQVLRRDADALDATQATFVLAFGQLADVRDPTAWHGWVRRVTITTARNLARRQRFTFIQPADVPDVPVLDEAETTWSDRQRQALARALLTLSTDTTAGRATGSTTAGGRRSGWRYRAGPPQAAPAHPRPLRDGLITLNIG